MLCPALRDVNLPGRARLETLLRIPPANLGQFDHYPVEKPLLKDNGQAQ
jgi:hypothetical protein